MVNKDLQGKQTNNAAIGITTTDENGKKSTITLTEAKKKARNSGTKANNEVLVKDIYQNVSMAGVFFLSPIELLLIFK